MVAVIICFPPDSSTLTVSHSPASHTLWFSVGAIFTFNTFPLVLTILEADRWHADRACLTHPAVTTSTGRENNNIVAGL